MQKRKEKEERDGSIHQNSQPHFHNPKSITNTASKHKRPKPTTGTCERRPLRPECVLEGVCGGECVQHATECAERRGVRGEHREDKGVCEMMDTAIEMA